MPGSAGNKLAKCLVEHFAKNLYSFWFFSLHTVIVVETDRGDRSCTDTEDVRPGE